MLKIGILGHGFVSWSGGLDFLRTVCSSLLACGEPLELHVLVPMQGPKVRVRDTLRKIKARIKHGAAASSFTQGPSVEDIKRLFAQLGDRVHVHVIDLGTSALWNTSRRLALDALIPSFQPLPFTRKLPWVGYLYDFQHRHLPQFFTERERETRNRLFANMLKAAPAVIVNAQAVAKDIAHYHPNIPSSVFALPFSPSPVPRWFNLDIKAAQQRYGMSAPYFIVCNQFWKHKDHATAFKAFASIASEAPEVQLVCTGATIEYRDRDYFPSLLQRVEQLGLKDRIHILGLIPKDDQISLLRGALALVQPTCFEGGPGGGAVYDAVSLGVPSIVSDIPVNLEINEPSVTFFKAGSADALAARMRQHLQLSNGSQPSAATLIADGQARRIACGKVLLQAIKKAQHTTSQGHM